MQAPAATAVMRVLTTGTVLQVAPRTTETPGSTLQAVLRQLEQATRPMRMEKASPISSLTMGMALLKPWARSSSFTVKLGRKLISPWAMAFTLGLHAASSWRIKLVYSCMWWG